MAPPLSASSRSAHALIVLLVMVLSLLAWHRTDGFSPSRIETSLTEPSDPIIECFCPEAWRYLGKGRQMFVFESLDGQYVLKLPIRKGVWSRWYYTSWLASLKERLRWEKKVQFSAKSYRLAFADLKEETGLCAVHLGASSHRWPIVTLFPGRGAPSVRWNLNDHPFVLQKKGESSFLEVLSDQKKRSVCIDAFLAYTTKRIALQIADGDRNLSRNYGWSGTELVCLDPGRFFHNPALSTPEGARWEWDHAVRNLRKWLVLHAPEELSSFDEKVKAWQQPR